ncbi:hypothetical protein IM793_19205 [Pedobacter sp. MR2016-19]|uniref:hypothetical protein n=1 Tax=Pedobacter sp. MR2016-19 TaxID=2780089 RepID=UPI0018774078|nr:hypothetical protein [Pedobacter sp. MR2016-19]MBE5321298.1 hypothetical protein [Pedobacter sp. MR2016-19]
MDTLIIELTNQKAYKLLKELEELHLIRVIKKNIKTSELRNQIKNQMNEKAIDAQLNDLRGEWQRDI